MPRRVKIARIKSDDNASTLTHIRVMRIAIACLETARLSAHASCVHIALRTTRVLCTFASNARNYAVNFKVHVFPLHRAHVVQDDKGVDLKSSASLSL
jgi:hypothetical protein